MNRKDFEDKSWLKNLICVVKEIQVNDHSDRLSNGINLSIGDSSTIIY